MITNIYTDYRHPEVRGWMAGKEPRAFAVAGEELVDIWSRPIRQIELAKSETRNRLRATQITRKDPSLHILSPDIEGWVLVRLHEGTVGWARKEALRVVETPEHPHEPLLTDAAFFELYRHTPYVRGGNTPKGIDCSGFVQRYFALVHGVWLPRHSTDQWKAGRPLHDEPCLPGDILQLRHRESSRDHVGICWEGGQVLHACLDQQGVSLESKKSVQERYDILGTTRIRSHE
ncbi:C40 family peptidase [Candidatus Uhrbacteria bacterium]|nr:C40 family peptidase [Candidatus Uhrbacteria bacterium]